MLVLSRRKDEGFVIGNDIRISIVDVGSGQVKIGISAPKHVPIVRDEIFEDVKKQNLASMAQKKPDSRHIQHLIKSLKKSQSHE